MILSVLVEAALRSILLAAAVWLALRLCRVERPNAQSVAWRLVLATSLAMPLLMQFRVELPLLPALPTSLGTHVAQAGPPVLNAVPEAPISPEIAPAANIAQPQRSFVLPSWQQLLLAFYIVVASVFLARFLLGLGLTLRMAADSKRIREDWTEHLHVRAGARVRTPLTFGSVILLPLTCAQWTAEERQAVIAHENAHVRHGDFYIHVLSTLHRAIFWFSPLSWWLHKKLSELAESISDDTALAHSIDRAWYARLLLDMSSGRRFMSAALPMASASTIRRRVERILSEASPAPALSKLKKRLLITSFAPLLALSAMTGPKAQDSSKVRQMQAASRTEAAREGSCAADIVKLGEPGNVRLRMVIGEDGIPRDARVTRPSVSPRLDAVAIACQNSRRLMPALLDGQPVPSSFDVDYRFSLGGPVRQRTIVAAGPGQGTAPSYAPARMTDGTSTNCMPMRELKGVGMGSVSVRMMVGADGRVRDAEIEKPNLHVALNDMAIRCALAMRFEPALLDGKPLQIPYGVTFRYGSLPLPEPSQLSVHPDVKERRDCVDKFYPAQSRDAKEQGDTLLEYVIGPEGALRDIKVVKSSGSQRLDAASVACARTFLETPGYRDGNPSSIIGHSKIVWRLPGTVEPNLNAQTLNDLMLTGDIVAYAYTQVEFTGRAQMRHGDKVLRADYMRLIKEYGEPLGVSAAGNVVWELPDGNKIGLDQAYYNLHAGTITGGGRNPRRQPRFHIFKDVPYVKSVPPSPGVIEQMVIRADPAPASPPQ